ncbi:MAG: helix-turn-helix domain-containing protein [Christensenellales bacterium]
MSENIRRIAMRVRELREIWGESIETAAEALNIPLERYKKYESGEADLSISFLCDIAARYKVEVTALMTGDDPRLHKYCLVRSGSGVSVERHREFQYKSLAYNFTNKKVQPFLVTVEPGAPETPVSLNAHAGQEFDYVLSGSLLLNVAGKEMALHAGDPIYFDSSYPHGMKAAGENPAVFLAVVI